MPTTTAHPFLLHFLLRVSLLHHHHLLDPGQYQDFVRTFARSSIGYAYKHFVNDSIQLCTIPIGPSWSQSKVCYASIDDNHSD